MKVKCPVVEDLLPLYVDEICSEESKAIVEEHLKECKSCSEKLQAQQGELVVDTNTIKENLNAKTPFQKIKRHQIITLIIVLICIPILFLTIFEISGDGLGFSALYGRYKTGRFLTYIEKGDFENAAELTAYTGGIYQNFSNEDQAKKEWISGMKKLKDEGIEIISHSENYIITDDRFISGYVTVSVKYKDAVHDFRVFISTNSGKVEPGNLSSDIKFDYSEPTDVEKILMEKVSRVISTYNPG